MSASEPGVSGSNHKAVATGIVVFSAAGALGATVATPFPWGRACWWLGDAAAFTGLALSAFAFLASVLMLASWRSLHNQRFVAVTLICIGLAIGAHSWFGSDKTMVERRILETSELRHNAEFWMRTHGHSSVTIVPPQARLLTFGRKTEVHMTENGEKYVFFPHFTQGIDNSEGFVWSFSGLEPPAHSFEQVSRCRRIDRHWFWINTT